VWSVQWGPFRVLFGGLDRIVDQELMRNFQVLGCKAVRARRFQTHFRGRGKRRGGGGGGSGGGSGGRGGGAGPSGADTAAAAGGALAAAERQQVARAITTLCKQYFIIKVPELQAYLRAQGLHRLASDGPALRALMVEADVATGARRPLRNFPRIKFVPDGDEIFITTRTRRLNNTCPCTRSPPPHN